MGQSFERGVQAGAILDRYLHHAQTIAIAGRSYRLKDHLTIAGNEDKSKKTKSKSTNLRPQNRQAEWLTFRFCSFYLAADGLWKTLVFYHESARLGALDKMNTSKAKQLVMLEKV